MKTSVDKITPTHVKLTINVAPDELKPYVEGAYRTIASQVQVPGFRKGKVPNAIIDQRVGREVVLDQAINDGLDNFYQQALAEAELLPLGRPEADVTETPNVDDLSGDLVVEIEVDVRPEIELADWKGLEIEVEAAEVSDEDVDAEIESLRERFGTLKTVDRPIENGDFAIIDLVAKIDGDIIDEASGLSHEVGSGDLLEGTDEALLTLTAGEETTFKSTLLGGEQAGSDAEITVKVQSVKERELPEIDDEFAQLASEFDTVDEMKADLREQAAKKKTFAQVDEARGKAVEALIAANEVPVPQQLIDDEVARHLEQEGKPLDDPHGDEVREEAEKSFRQQVILDEIIKAEGVEVEQDEFTEFLFQQSMQYGVSPQQFVEIMQQNNQMPQMVGEVARSKAILYVLEAAKVVDNKGNDVDISEYTVSVRNAREKQAAAESETETEADAE
ncbi:trigger factor [Gulosibacter macacae]|uniref:Trigger factor n=1 Tax=Gulosibacter macacae TaxID=2488791 RepID=A0A3P3VYL7_9MICO|nr:trigger factor [Gulosibacter macacae]RRJ87800.1 trigger factor [Gulosibacter macacae]